ncbi:receptor-like protein EIX1 isoform X2 [Pyrus x bretschneideri]|nr:receptor-like protein EIX1 isoform X2 [Pyrus x bretschneideri]XP_048446680.1 receptor-like protein EIX1 isoform X2 [Pyrus x bretschneideri]XP_048446681.1 receptor-like protein EIX1 isoform X2 [Pyrus x bretschneideri]
MFKQDLKDPANRIASWVAEEDSDCCSWIGVVCDHMTGHIHELHLNNSDSDWDCNSCFGGKINPSLLSLKHLKYLDLSENNFNTTRIPSFFGSMTSLTHLNLGYSWFDGVIPHKLGNLSSLRYLNLSNYNLKVDNLRWISGLSLLKHLDLSHVDLSKASDWLQVTNMLPSLAELIMFDCQLDQIPHLPIANFTSLVVLDLSDNHFNSLMLRWVFSIKNLVSLRLSDCGFQGPIPSISQNITSLREIDLSSNSISLDPIPNFIQNMTGLKVLNLEENNFNSTIPEWLYSLNNLESLLLSYNELRGEISSSIGNMTSLVNLHLDGNRLEGKIPNSLGHLCKLKVLDLSKNHFTVRRPSEIFESLSRCGPDGIKSLSLRYTNISGPIPMSLGNLSSLEKLDISENQFNGTFTEVIGQLKMLTELDISYNSLEGAVSEVSFSNLTKLKHFFAIGNSLTLKTSRDWVPPFQLEILRLDSWHLGPEWPMWLRTQTQLQILSLSGTQISSTIPTWFWNLTSQVDYLNISHNQLHGQIPNIFGAQKIVDLSSNHFTGALPIVPTSLYWLDLSNSSFSGSVFHFFCDRPDETKQLLVVHLGNNLLTGKVPDCWMSWQYLRFLNLENNNLTGNVPMSMGYLQELESLHLRNNHLYGELPHSLQNCTELSVVDLSENGFSGSIPIWIGRSLSGLHVLDLRSNKFEGDIPNEVCYLKSLQILDLAHNKLSGMIPRCFHNLSALANFSESFSPVHAVMVTESAILVTKGIEMEYSNILGFVKGMDLSCNFMYGEIPEELTGLLALQSLNLSNNRFTGRIPSKIGNMAQLESLDFSMNQLDGEIPPSMTNLTFLSHLNLAYNNLTGRIPESTQLQSLDQSSFVGNELCGAPLNKNCSTNGVIPPATVEQDGGGGYRLLEDGWFYVSLGVGFFTGFWIVLGSLLVNMPWSVLLSQLLNRIVLKMYHVIVEYV